MGMGHCRFDCGYGTSDNIHVYFPDYELVICGAWDHYMTQHKVQLPLHERGIVMASDPSQARSEVIRYRSGSNPQRLPILFVEKTQSGFNHQIGPTVDTEGRNKLEALIKANLKRDSYSETSNGIPR